MCMSFGASASEISKESTSLYIQSLECPEDIVDYVRNNVTRFVMSMDETVKLSYDEVKVGKPFTYGESATNLYTFPVFCGNQIVYTFRVAYTPSGEISGTMSTFLVDELNKYMGETTESTPLLLEVVDGTLVASLGEMTETIAEFPEDELLADLTTLTSAQERRTLATFNAADHLDVDLNWNLTRATPKYIALSLTEYQGENSWCSAYVTAAILRTINGGSLTAQQVMQYYYGSNPSTSQSLSMPLAAAYARDVGGLTAATYTSNGLSNADLIDQLESDWPVYLSMENRTTSGYHAIALRGYSLATSTWSVWNPSNVNMRYESYGFNDYYVSTLGNTFEYDGRTIYNYYNPYA